jgi:hypothetical protein
MLQWKPRRLLGVGVGVGAILLILALDAVLLSALTSQPFSFSSFVMGLLVALSLLALALILYQIYGLASLKYLLGRDSITISWARRQEIIPLAAIESITLLAEQGGALVRRGFHYPGYNIGKGRDGEGRDLLAYSNGRLSDELLITTGAVSYLISPAKPTGFLSAVRARKRLGPARKLEQERMEGGLAGLPVWRDRAALALLSSAAAANAGLFAYIAFCYPSLPEIVPLLSEAGQVTLIGAREELFELPLIGLAVVLANTALGLVLHRQERLVTYALGAIALLVQILVWSAAMGAMR